MLLPAVALGLGILPLPSQPGWVGRGLPPLAAGFGAAVSLSFSSAENGGNWFTSYCSTPELLAMAGGLMFALVLLIGLGRALRADDTGLWAALLLATPAALFGADQQPRDLGQPRRRTQPDSPRRHDRAIIAGSALLAVGLAGQAARHRTVRRRVLDAACPACGHRPEATA
ncbi:hypothetical protein Xph01_48170 [Micromonospora phaseoli]|nr:hypothetical protein Xph01_48170 [Micromonospora phaseoli]